MKIALGADHGGVGLKRIVHQHLEQKGHFVLNMGTDADGAVDYPDFAFKVAAAVTTGEAERGIMICGSGVGACITTNKVPGVRAGLCHDTFSAHQGVEDDDMNVLCMGARVIGSDLALEVVDAFAGARFSEAERHVRRKNKVLAIEARYTKAEAP
jgi:ribose 5-phosphate isomerase B